MTFPHGHHQGCLLKRRVFRIDDCAAVKKNLHRIEIAHARGSHQCSLTSRIGGVGIGAGIEQQLDHGSVAVETGEIERGYAVPVRKFGIRTGAKQ